MRSSLANAALAVEDRVVLGAGDLARGTVDAVKWPFQRIAWAVEHWLVWPIQEETSLWSRPTRFAVLAATLLLAGGAVAAGVVLSDPSAGESAKVATLPGPGARTAGAVVVHKAVAPTGPTLHGSAPNFAPESGGAVAKGGESEVLRSEPSGGQAAAPGAKATETGAETKVESGASEQPAGGAKGTAPEVAGPAAIKVAREFAGAFVLYEIGTETPKVKAAITKAASPDLTKALLRRPPRLPSNVKVPEAKVLNIVPGPVHDGTYTLSVSLLRVGATSELRLDMKRSKDGTWQVVDALG